MMKVPSDRSRAARGSTTRDTDHRATIGLRRQVAERDGVRETLDRRRLAHAGLAGRLAEGRHRGGLRGDVRRAAEDGDLDLLAVHQAAAGR